MISAVIQGYLFKQAEEEDEEQADSDMALQATQAPAAGNSAMNRGAAVMRAAKGNFNAASEGYVKSRIDQKRYGGGSRGRLGGVPKKLMPSDDYIMGRSNPLASDSQARTNLHWIGGRDKSLRSTGELAAPVMRGARSAGKQAYQNTMQGMPSEAAQMASRRALARYSSMKNEQKKQRGAA